MSSDNLIQEDVLGPDDPDERSLRLRMTFATKSLTAATASYLLHYSPFFDVSLFTSSFSRPTSITFPSTTAFILCAVSNSTGNPDGTWYLCNQTTSIYLLLCIRWLS